MHKILVIEDDKFLKELLVQKLKKEGYEVLEVSEGNEGFKKMKEGKPSLVLLDLILPGVDGFQVLKAAKEDKDTSPIPIVVLSNLGEQNDIEKALKMGAADFMIKAHFTPGEVIGRIKTLLG
ncbi:MAG: response regulator [Candidatus Wildermuthbacteria bacterium]|nr:response regulator [Candidatus Wildermuthbacteria bacterium]